jgi:hypothetical protein
MPLCGDSVNSMKKRRRNARRLQDLFLNTCGWCGIALGHDQPRLAGSGKTRPGVDLSELKGQVLPISLLHAERTILIAVPGAGSEAERTGADLLFVCCSERCRDRFNEAIQLDIDLGNSLSLSKLEALDDDDEKDAE